MYVCMYLCVCVCVYVCVVCVCVCVCPASGRSREHACALENEMGRVSMCAMCLVVGGGYGGSGEKGDSNN